MTDTITVTDEYVVEAGVTLSFMDVSPAFVLQSQTDGVTPTLINKGVVTVSSDQFSTRIVGIEGDSTYAGGSIWNQAGAQFSVSDTDVSSNVDGFYLRGPDYTFLNDGEFDVQTSGYARGGAAISGLSFTNTGHFIVVGPSGAAGLLMAGSFANSNVFLVSSSGSANGVDFSIMNGTFSNAGHFLVTGGGPDVLGVSFGGSADFSNTGKIIVRNTGPQDGVGVFLRGAMVHSFENSGLIKADMVIDVEYKTPLGVEVQNTGKLIGDVHLIQSDDIIHNQGHMSGQISLGAGDDVYDGAHGGLKGAVYGGMGSDTITGGKASEFLCGDDGHDTAGDKADVISGGAGADTLIGGQGADHLSGGTGADVFVYLSLADSTVDAADLIVGLTNADRIDLSAIDADTTQAGDQAFTLVADLSGHAGQAALVYDAVAKQTELLLDVDGDGAADAAVLIKGDHTGFDNFVL